MTTVDENYRRQTMEMDILKTKNNPILVQFDI